MSSTGGNRQARGGSPGGLFRCSSRGTREDSRDSPRMMIWPRMVYPLPPKALEPRPALPALRKPRRGSLRVRHSTGRP